MPGMGRFVCEDKPPQLHRGGPPQGAHHPLGDEKARGGRRGPAVISPFRVHVCRHDVRRAPKRRHRASRIPNSVAPPVLVPMYTPIPASSPLQASTNVRGVCTHEPHICAHATATPKHSSTCATPFHSPPVWLVLKCVPSVCVAVQQRNVLLSQHICPLGHAQQQSREHHMSVGGFDGPDQPSPPLSPSWINPGYPREGTAVIRAQVLAPLGRCRKHPAPRDLRQPTIRPMVLND